MKNLTYVLLMLSFLVSSTTVFAGKSEPTNTSVSEVGRGTVTGHVVDAKTKKHLAGIVINIKGSKMGAVTDKTGHFTLKNIPTGQATLVMRGVGYLHQEKVVEVKPGDVANIGFEAEEDPIHLDEVVVSSNRQTTLRRLAPTVVNVLSSDICTLTNSTNLSQGLSFQPGVRVETNCQNCGFNQVRINGLDGRYTQLLIDSRPIMNALSGVYGLEQIPANMIERVEVVRGGGSALYGSSAIAGVINIITKEPSSNQFSFTESLTLTGMSKPDNNMGFNASLVSDNSRIGAMLFGQARNRAGWDSDGDGSTELGRLDSRSFGTNVYIKTSDYSKLTTEVHTLYEDRHGGNQLDWPDHVAPVSEHLQHSIYSSNAKWDLFSTDYKHHFQIFGSGQLIKRNSYYGGLDEWDDKWGTLGNPVPEDMHGKNFGVTRSQTYNAGVQYTYDMDHFLFMPAQLLLGVEYTHDRLHDKMPIRAWDEVKPKVATFSEIKQSINNWSQLAQIEWKDEHFNFLLGSRIDKHSALDKLAFSPRVALRYAPAEWINIRGAYAKGFRAPQVFDEDLHTAMAGAEVQKVYNEENLRPEISHAFNLSTEFFFGERDGLQGNILVEGFMNRLKDVFTNVEEGSEEGITILKRINGSGAKVYGINLEGRIAYRWAQLQAGFTLAKSLYDSPEEWGLRAEDKDGNPITPEDFGKLSSIEWSNASQVSKNMTRTPSTYGYFTLNLTPIEPLSIALTGTYTGRMYVPHIIEMGKGAAEKDPAKGIDVPETDDGIRADDLFYSPHFFDLGGRVAYTFHPASVGDLELFVGIHNMFNSFQKDYDKGIYRDAAYVYGPRMPRSAVFGMKFSF